MRQRNVLNVLMVILVGIALLIILAVQHSTQAQRPSEPGSRPGRSSAGTSMMQSIPLEASWSQICFEIAVEDELLPKARKIYKEAWDKRKELSKKAEEAAGDRETMQSIRSDSEKIKSDMMTKLRDVLSAEQMAKLVEWEKKSQQQERRPPMPPGGPGSPE